jgi:hypothetical protein
MAQASLPEPHARIASAAGTSYASNGLLSPNRRGATMAQIASTNPNASIVPSPFPALHGLQVACYANPCPPSSYR